MSLLEVNNLCVFRGKNKILNDISFSVSSGDWLMLIGPNGSGKSTLIKGIMGELETTGLVKLNDKDFHSFSNVEKALNIGVLSQKNNPMYSFTVKEVVELGTYAKKKGIFKIKSKEDSTYIDEILKKTKLYDLKNKSILSLSGGELQRVFLAQVFAQNPDILILDEPINNLDVNFQKEILEYIFEWKNKNNKTVISVIHDLNLAYTFCTKAMILDKGIIKSLGEKTEVFSPNNLNEVYKIDVRNWFTSVNNLY